MSSPPKTELTPGEYLAAERLAEAKSEYLAGRAFLLAGASQRHNLIAANLIAELRSQLKTRDCEVYPSDMRVKVAATGLYTYPDVVVVCGEAAFEDPHRDTLLNPTLIFEVLSASTEAYDRGRKFEHYRACATLSDYVLVAQDRREVEHFPRQGLGTWVLAAYSAAHDTVRLAAIGCSLPLTEIYHKVDLAG